MILNNNRRHFYGSVIAAESRPARLIFFGLLLFGVTSTHAQEDEKNKGWTIESNTSLNKPAKPKPSERVREIISAPLSGDDNLALYDISVGAKPLDIPLINIDPTITLSPELRVSLERQFKEIQSLKETEDAYNEQLGESYFSYGRALVQAGRADEARKMLVNALHITKINNGVTSIEQRSVLRELFEMSLALGNSEDAKEQLDKIIWLEKKIPSDSDIYSFDMVIRLGNYFLDLYLSKPVVNQVSLDYLNTSARYFNYAVNRYGDRPLSEILLPYGELAFVLPIRSRVQYEVFSTLNQDTRQRRLSELNRPPKFAQQYSGNSSFSRSEKLLNEYLIKAKTERDLVNTIQALLGLGDLNLMSDRFRAADKYYDLAWRRAQNLPLSHPIVESFNAPVKLPAYNFSIVRKPVLPVNGVDLVPFNIDIGNRGRVRKNTRDDLIKTSVSQGIRAQRVIKNTRFRPIIENGMLVSVNDYRYEVPVSRRKKRAAAVKKQTKQ